jgi:7-carboxy-7-deazaguanine synthase
MDKLTVSEIYASIQGESSYTGFPCVFVRLTGCPLRCRWCDTVHAFKGGKETTVDDVLEQVLAHKIQVVELTGGEPLAQEHTPLLMQRLIDAGKTVLIETGGSEDISRLPAKAHVIMDIKCPGSKMQDRNLWTNIEVLKPTDEVKFVIVDQADFDWAINVIQEFRLDQKCQILISPAFGLMNPKDLAQMVVETKLNIRMQLQIHKYIWNPKAKGV